MAELLKVLTQALYLLMRGSVLQNNNRLVSVILATTAPRVRGLLGTILSRSSKVNYEGISGHGFKSLGINSDLHSSHGF